MYGHVKGSPERGPGPRFWRDRFVGNDADTVSYLYGLGECKGNLTVSLAGGEKRLDLGSVRT